MELYGPEQKHILYLDFGTQTLLLVGFYLLDLMTIKKKYVAYNITNLMFIPLPLWNKSYTFLHCLQNILGATY